MKLNKKRVTDNLGNQKISSKKVYKSINDEDNIPILISGGTNSHSKQLANLSGVKINGVAIGTYARDLIEKYIIDDNFFDNDNNIFEAFIIAKNLVTESNKAYHG